jgi:hypothetical protein
MVEDVAAEFRLETESWAPMRRLGMHRRENLDFPDDRFDPEAGMAMAAR